MTNENAIFAFYTSMYWSQNMFTHTVWTGFERRVSNDIFESFQIYDVIKSTYPLRIIKLKYNL